MWEIRLSSCLASWRASLSSLVDQLYTSGMFSGLVRKSASELQKRKPTKLQSKLFVLVLLHLLSSPSLAQTMLPQEVILKPNDLAPARGVFFSEDRFKEFKTRLETCTATQAAKEVSPCSAEPSNDWVMMPAFITGFTIGLVLRFIIGR